MEGERGEGRRGQGKGKGQGRARRRQDTETQDASLPTGSSSELDGGGDSQIWNSCLERKEGRKKRGEEGIYRGEDYLPARGVNGQNAQI